MPDRFASFTSISGPSLDHVGHWMRRNLARPTPGSLRRAAGQAARSWYIYFFQTPVLPEALWLGGMTRLFTRALAVGEGVEPRPGHPARTMARDAAAGVGLYRANMVRRLRRPAYGCTDVPTQVIIPTRDLFVSPHLVGGLGERVPNLSLRPIAAGHWVPRSHPGVVARWITEHIAARRRPAHRRRGPGARPGAGTAGAAPVRRLARRRHRRRQGIGRATALAFAGRGAEIIAADLDLETARRTAELAGRGTAHAFQVDVSDPTAMEDFAKAVLHEHGVPDVVVNNAGIGMAGSFFDHSADDWRKVLDVNLGASSTAHGSSPSRWWNAGTAATSSTRRRPPRSRRPAHCPHTPPARRRC